MNESLEYIFDFTKIVSFLFSIIALYISLKVYKIFHFREIQKKQLDLVLKLIKDFQEFDFNITLVNYNEKYPYGIQILDGNIFSLADKKKDSKVSLLQKNEVINFPVYLTEEVINQIKISEYIHNPIMPNKISNKLRSVFSDKITLSKRESPSYDYVLVDISQSLDSKEIDELKIKSFSPYISSLGMNYGSFLQSTNELKIEINNWLKKIGIKDLNLKWNK